MSERPQEHVCPGCGRRVWHLYIFPEGVCRRCLKNMVSPRSGATEEKRMSQFFGDLLKAFLRFGPLIGAALLALVSAPFIGADVANILQSILAVIGFLGIEVDQEAVALFGEAFVAVTILIGVVRKVWNLIKKYAELKAAE